MTSGGGASEDRRDLRRAEPDKARDARCDSGVAQSRAVPLAKRRKAVARASSAARGRAPARHDHHDPGPPSLSSCGGAGHVASALVLAGGDLTSASGNFCPSQKTAGAFGVTGVCKCVKETGSPAGNLRRTPPSWCPRSASRRPQRLATDRSNASQALRHCGSRADGNAARHWLARGLSPLFGIVICRAGEQSPRGFLAAHPEHAR